jgi:hypothetical protein
VTGKFLVIIAALPFIALGAGASNCVDCHENVTPGIVTDWELSRHGQLGLDCSICHGDGHTSATDAANAGIPTPDICADCHSAPVEQFKGGKHAFAWAAMHALSSVHLEPAAPAEDMKGCGGCHKIGLKTEDEIKTLKAGGGGFGVASCDECHTRHLFSAAEAREPQACRTCHTGSGYPQWEMYSSSKHGVRYLLKQNGILPESSSAPTCQTCHMDGGDHAVRTSWSYLAVRLPLPEDEVWAQDQVTVLQGLGILDPEGNPTGVLDSVKKADVARLTEEDWQRERDKMLDTCGDCHSSDFAKAELEKGDDMIRKTDRLMAEAISTVAGLYRDGILEVPDTYAYVFPDLLAYHDAPTPVERTLSEMYLKHRMRAIHGTFHANPDYALCRGWSLMGQDLIEINEMAAGLREKH